MFFSDAGMFKKRKSENASKAMLITIPKIKRTTRGPLILLSIVRNKSNMRNMNKRVLIKNNMV